MKKVLGTNTQAGSERTSEPRLIGELLNDFIENSNEPLAVALRNREAYGDHFNDDSCLIKNTHLCVDLTTHLKGVAIPELWDNYMGVLRKVDEFEFEFVETNTLTTRVKRNPQVFNGRYITVTQWDDGSLHPHLKQVRITPGFNLHNYILGIGRELRLALKGLVKK